MGEVIGVVGPQGGVLGIRLMLREMKVMSRHTILDDAGAGIRYGNAQCIRCVYEES